MTVKFAFQVLTAVALVAVAVFEMVQLARRRDDLALRVLVPGITSLAVVVTLGIPIPVLKPLDDALGEVGFSNIAWMFMAFCFATFFVLADHQEPRTARTRQALIELVLLVLAVATLVAVTETAPPGTWHTPRLPEDYRTWRNAVFYLSVDGYALTVWAVGTWRAIRYARRLEHPWARLALFVVVAGTAGMAIGVDGVSLVRQVLYVIFPGSKWPFLRTVYNTGRLGGQLLLAAGLALAPLAAAVVRAGARYDRFLQSRYKRRMAPLWHILVGEFPYIVLRRGTDDGASPHELGERDFGHMTNEVTDGLARLARHCAGPLHGVHDPRAAARIVVRALETRAANHRNRWAGGATEPMLPPFPRIEPDFGRSWRGRARWMVDLSRELERHGRTRETKKDYGTVAAG